jgi:signal transduction histidine kinase/ActR/RegA family two-component response regulator
MNKPVERTLVIWFSVILIVLIGNIALSYRATRVIIEHEQRVTHTYRVIVELDATLSNLVDAETGQRGFLITGSDSFLDPYNEAIATVGNHLQNIRDLTADNPVQQRSVSILEPKIKERLSIIDESIRLRRQEGFEAARNILLTNRGKIAMDAIRNTIADMKSEEEMLLHRRDAESNASALQARWTYIIAGVLAAIMLGIFYYQFKRNISERATILEHEQAARADAETAYKAEQQARSDAEKANRLKDEFLATVSHELRTPLNAIIGWSRMLRTGKLDSESFARGLDAIDRNAKSQAQLVEDLLDTSRIISGKLRLDVRPVDFARVIDAAIDAVRPAADARNIQIRKVLDPDAGAVSGDPERLQQVVWNLLSNAIKFTPRDGRVEVRLERINSHVEVIVSDTGKGINADFLPHVFELFRQADSTISREHTGLGLGLAIARRIVEMHGGTIRADSPGVNQGATFTVMVPLRGVRSLDGLPGAGLERVHPTTGYDWQFENLFSLDGLRILAVDDQSDTLEMIKAVLTQCGAEVQTATSAGEAFEVLQDWKPDILISDIGMPGEDGFALIGKIRALKPEEGGLIPAVALTAYARVEDRLKTLSAGYQMHVPKPVEPAELATIIASLAGRTGKTFTA